MIKDIITAPKELKRIGQEIKKHSKEIREGVKLNGYCLDHICQDFKPVVKKP